ncbi:Alkylated DNA repair protein alkB 8 [Modicella reniformis]|uniref:Alkylated DNA repair protein alkB 8 n=1 Tax=Modicella reniformis TaxID=1440133 RepID=A0A9P6IJ42_9FUNG|nr:Alkylated DNA repair protein alkB 8 [Modicella reniformis]
MSHNKNARNPLHKPSPFQADTPDMTPEQKEQVHVHNVYQAIAPHFSATRYKPWPIVEEFLKNMPSGSIGADVGCGNGKYIGVNPKLFMVGSDRSSNLVGICSERGHEAMVCDGLALPYRPELFDFAISIAVIHHFTSPERRLAAIEEILRVVRPGAKVLIFVWALEQTGRRDFDKNVQDVFVPWAMTKKGEPTGRAGSRPQRVGRNDQRTTSLTASGLSITESVDQFTIQRDQSQELQIHPSASTLVSTPISTPSLPTASAQEDAYVAAQMMNANVVDPAESATPVFNRYYHLFHKGELEDLVAQTNKASVVQAGYDRDNWWCILKKD